MEGKWWAGGEPGAEWNGGLGGGEVRRESGGPGSPALNHTGDLKTRSFGDAAVLSHPPVPAQSGKHASAETW